ncbi:hypothetical protein TNCV_4942541 [Trichonephila clavipes]|nr:hypothetical protein TNCV_4942541 [Trichonephila clavipes]
MTSVDHNTRNSTEDKGIFETESDDDSIYHLPKISGVVVEGSWSRTCGRRHQAVDLSSGATEDSPFRGTDAHQI